ncbi:MAG: hypothetical protein RTV31_02035 [Candidatus Thorarchaeota archaeon]
MTVLACLLIFAIVAVTGIIPLSLQGPFILSLTFTMIIGGAISLAGYFKSFDRQAYRVSIGLFFIPVIFFVIWALTR